ncbi:MAG: hypothetical protein NTZ83_03515 [Candidatus Pacearchaeota archaeon]|nr:hypothetical protein [Candidatus Pacearchaeota archaeon]
MENNAKLISPREINGFSWKSHNRPLFGRGAYFIDDKMCFFGKRGVEEFIINIKKIGLLS